MSIFSNILKKIFPASHTEVAGASVGAPTGAAPPLARASPGATPAATQVDVERILNDLGSRNPQKLNWRTSIVDLMKLLGLDSGLEARKSLAQELHYTGDMNDSAGMNIWLHKQVMKKLAENGGKVPEDLKS
jgi:hypothetical protein